MNKDNTDFRTWYDAVVARIAELSGGELKYSDEVVKAFDDGKTVDEAAEYLTV